jgi:CRP-like cAMP-binding protein
MVDRAMSGFFESLTAQERRALLRRGRRRRYRSGAVLLREGERSGAVFVVLSGRVKISSFAEEGDEIVITVRGSGELLGEDSFVDQEPHMATGTALGPVDALVVSTEAFAEFLEESPHAGRVLLRTGYERLREATRWKIVLGPLNTTGRVALRLVALADKYGETSGDHVRIQLSLSQEELAGWVGASREAVSKALRALRERGLIETHRRHITILNREALRLHTT